MRVTLNEREAWLLRLGCAMKIQHFINLKNPDFSEEKINETIKEFEALEIKLRP